MFGTIIIVLTLQFRNIFLIHYIILVLNKQFSCIKISKILTRIYDVGLRHESKVLRKNCSTPILPCPRFLALDRAQVLFTLSLLVFVSPPPSPKPRLTLQKSNPKLLESEPFLRDDLLMEINAEVAWQCCEVSSTSRPPPPRTNTTGVEGGSQHTTLVGLISNPFMSVTMSTAS